MGSNKDNLKLSFAFNKVPTGSDFANVIDQVLSNANIAYVGASSTVNDQLTFSKADGSTVNYTLPKNGDDDIDRSKILSKVSLNTNNISFDIVSFYNYLGNMTFQQQIDKSTLSTNFDKSKIMSTVEQDEDDNNTNYTFQALDGTTAAGSMEVPKTKSDGEPQLDQSKIASSVNSSEDDKTYSYDVMAYDGKTKISTIKTSKVITGSDYKTIKNIFPTATIKGFDDAEFDKTNIQIPTSFKMGTADKKNYTMGYTSIKNVGLSFIMSADNQNFTIEDVAGIIGAKKQFSYDYSSLDLKNSSGDKVANVALLPSMTSENTILGVFDLDFNISYNKSSDYNNTIKSGTYTLSSSSSDLTKIFKVKEKNFIDKIQYGTLFKGRTTIMDSGDLFNVILSFDSSKATSTDLTVKIDIDNITKTASNNEIDLSSSNQLLGLETHRILQRITK